MGSVRGHECARALAHACSTCSHLIGAYAYRLENLEQEQPQEGMIVALADLSQRFNRLVSVY